MARKRKRRQPATTASHGWAWMLFGLAIGLVIAAVVYLNGQRAQLPAPVAVNRATAPAQQPSTPARATAPSDVSTSSEPHPASRFDFYDMLSQVEVVIPDAPRSRDRAAPTPTVEAAGNYVLQAGSFTRLEDADRMQANLALLGIESRIQSVPLDDDIYHRVRIGPIDDLEELNRIRRRLWEQDVDTMLLRVPN